MPKFKRVNLAKLVKQENVSYTTVDLLNQKTIEKWCKLLNDWSAKTVKNRLLNNIKKLLDLMVVNDKKQKEQDDVRSQIQS